jgi:predicted dehydrogenase
MRDLLRDFYEAVWDGRPTEGEQPYPTLEDGARAVALVDAVLESARTERWVRPA